MKPNIPNQTYKTKPTKPNQTDQTKPRLPNQTYQSKPNLPNLTYQTKSNLAYQAYWTKPTKPKLLVKAVNAWVRSAFGNVFELILWFNPKSLVLNWKKILQI